MKKNKMMRLASMLLIMVLLTTSVISGTFAKYTTSATSNDSARVAVWGINAGTVEMDLFDDSYETGNLTVNANDGENLIAPGTTKSSKFNIINADDSLKPEVAYNITIDLTGSEIAQSIKDNNNIKWKLDDGEWGTWDNLMTSILRLSGDNTVTYEADTTESVTKKYEANTVATEFANGETHTIYWEWKFNETDSGNDVYDTDSDGVNDMTQDEYDTLMGNMDEMDDVSIKITITATQVD